MIAGIIAAAYSFSALAATADVQVKPLTATAQKAANTADYLIGKTWVTTEALDQDGKAIPATDESVAGFFGLANYEKTVPLRCTPEGKLKLQGDWSFSADGKTGR